MLFNYPNIFAVENNQTDRHKQLGEDNLDSLIRIKVDAPPLAHRDATGAVNLWWKNKAHRVVKDCTALPPAATKTQASISSQTQTRGVDIITSCLNISTG